MRIHELNKDMILASDKNLVKAEISLLSERLNGFVYQLFKLRPEETKIIERYLCENPENQEVEE